MSELEVIMKMKLDDALIYKDSQLSMRYGTGVVTAVTSDEYTILWSARGSTRYKRSILDGKLEEIFQRVDKGGDLPKGRQLHLGASKAGVPFNENYDRAKVESLCEKLKASGANKAEDVAAGLGKHLFTKKLALRGGAKTVLFRLAQLCNTRRDELAKNAREISRELFFGYVLQESDFTDPSTAE
jgi:hypothetical protein